MLGIKLRKIEKPSTDWTKPKETLTTIKKYIIDTAESELFWYSTARLKNGIFTRTVRFIALLLFGLGLLLPLLNIEKDTVFSHPINSLGYLCLATGGVILLFDKYFGLSSGFLRFYVAEEDIKRGIGEFEVAWEMEMVKAESSNYTTESIVNTLTVAKVLRQAVSNTIQIETIAWATEFQTQIGELQELLKQKLNEYKKQLGTVSVIVENSDGYTDIELILDETVIRKLSGTTSALFRDVSLEMHQIQIRATKNNKTESFSKNFEVLTDKTAEVILKLP